MFVELGRLGVEVLLLNEYSGGRGRLEAMLSIAVENYEGFGLI